MCARWRPPNRTPFFASSEGTTRCGPASMTTRTNAAVNTIAVPKPTRTGSRKWRGLQRAFERVPLEGDIIELAAGTGAWTARLIERARSLTVLDASPEMLARNRERLGPASERVVYGVVDLFDWRPTRTWDACVFGFWLCKVPDARLGRFMQAVADALRPGGVVCCLDKAAGAERATELEERTLNDGRRFTIVDHPRPPSRIADVFHAAGMDVDVQTFGSRFCLASGVKSAGG